MNESAHTEQIRLRILALAEDARHALPGRDIKADASGVWLVTDRYEKCIAQVSILGTVEVLMDHDMNTPVVREIQKPMSESEVWVEDYNAGKSICVRGDTRPFKDELKDLGGWFRPRLRGEPGWIFPEGQRTDVVALVNRIMGAVAEHQGDGSSAEPEYPF